MTSIPGWLSLVVGLLGGGFGSAILTQYVASLREAKARSYEHRKEAYMNFITKFYKEWSFLDEKRDLDWPQGDPPEDYLSPLYELLVPVEIFGSARAANLAKKALDELWRTTDDAVIADIVDRLKYQVRRDLSIPGYRQKAKPEPVPEVPSTPPPPPVPPPWVPPPATNPGQTTTK
jgi:hypothetical protein